MNAVRLIDVAKTFRSPKKTTQVFDGLNAEFPAGASVGILGSRGAGKSTLIRLIGGATLPDRGRIERRGTVSPPVANTQAYHASLTGRENLHFVARIHGFDGDAIAHFVEHFSGLGEALDQPLSSLTREKRARFLFATSYAMPFDVFIADESLVGGVGPFRAQCAELIQARRNGAALIFTSRSPQMLRQFADIGAVLHGGRLIFFEHVRDAIRAFLALDGSAASSDSTSSFDEEDGEEKFVEEPFGPLA